MKLPLFLGAGLSAALLLTACVSTAANDGFVPLFNGKDLTGWRPNENPSTFSVVNGEMVVKGERSHLFYNGPVNGGNFTNFHLRLEIMTKPKANSGVYFHTQFQNSGWPSKGYEVQVNNTHSDPKKTAGLYGVDDNMEAPAKDNEWFTMEIRVEGRRIITKVNDKVIKDYTQPERREGPQGFSGRLLGSGTIAIQGHDPESVIHYRKIEIKPLP